MARPPPGRTTSASGRCPPANRMTAGPGCPPADPDRRGSRAEPIMDCMAEGTSGNPIVIVGGGLAGGNAAATLREEGFAGPVVLISPEPGVPFGRLPLSKPYRPL